MMGAIKLNIVDQVSNKLAVSINKNSANSSSIAVLKFGISATINLLIMVLIVMIVCIITGDFVKGLIACFMFPILRYFSGGLHLKSANVCNVVSAILVLISVYLPISYWYNGLVINVLTIGILLIFAPSGIKRSKLPAKYYPVLKLISIVIVGSNFIVQSPLLAVVFFTQSITTLPVLSRLLDRMKW